MNYSDLKTAVLNDTKAVQHEDLIARKILAAIRFISMSGKYADDLQEVTIGTADGVVDTSHSQALTVPARYRHTAYLISSSCTGQKFKGYKAEEIVAKPYATNIFYKGGSVFHIKNEVLTSEFAWGYYTYPQDLASDTDTNWLTDLAPELIIDYSASMIFAQLGEKERIKNISTFSQQNLAIVIKDLIDPGGRTV